jgi:putative ABC transport system permease protein
MQYALQILWWERARYFPGILSVTFAALLVGLQCGLLLGLFSSTSLVLDRTDADIWVGSHGVASVDQGQAIPERHLARLASQPEVKRCEVYLQGRGLWNRPDGSNELCMIVGSRLEEGALGAIRQLTPELRARLTEPRTVVIDESDLGRLGISGVGAMAEISERRVRVVGLVRGLKGLANAYVFCSIQTARELLYLKSDETIYLLGRCPDRAAAAAVVRRFAADQQLSAFTQLDFSRRSRLYWLLKTRAGLAFGWAAILGLIVGTVITGQTLYAATAVNLREYAVLRAMGIPRYRMALVVGWQCLAVGVAGLLLSLPLIFALAGLADLFGIRVLLPGWLLAGMSLTTLVVALVSGLAALRLVLRVEPALLLR